MADEAAVARFAHERLAGVPDETTSSSTEASS
jgi:hypothetical protein